MLNFYHQNYIRRLVSDALDPLTQVATENVDDVFQLKEDLKKLKYDFEFEQQFVKSTFSKMCTLKEMNSKLNTSEAK